MLQEGTMQIADEDVETLEDEATTDTIMEVPAVVLLTMFLRMLLLWPLVLSFSKIMLKPCPLILLNATIINLMRLKSINTAMVPEEDTVFQLLSLLTLLLLSRK
jgi:hypothetical protein